MRRESYQQFAIVASDSAQELTDRLNAEMFRLRDKRPTVSFEGMIARISYTEYSEIFESIADEYRGEGINLTCQDCPIFKPILKTDGTADARVKWGDCPLCDFGRTTRDSAACERLFKMINSGEVRLCLAD